jgi:thiol-disulfide isomerase/thioredoxin
MNSMMMGILCITSIICFGYVIKVMLVPKKVTDSDKYIDLYYFYTSWCPYCKKSFSEWNKFKSEWNQKVYQGYTIHFHEVDCDIQEALASKYNVTQYPTIKMIKDGSIIDYDAKPSIHSLTIFLTSSFD